MPNGGEFESSIYTMTPTDGTLASDFLFAVAIFLEWENREPSHVDTSGDADPSNLLPTDQRLIKLQPVAAKTRVACSCLTVIWGTITADAVTFNTPEQVTLARFWSL